MPSFDEVSAKRAKRRMRIYGHLATACIAVLLTLALLAACSSVEKTIEYQNRADLVRCQAQEPGWAASCRHVQQVQAEYQAAPAPSAIISNNY